MIQGNFPPQVQDLRSANKSKYITNGQFQSLLSNAKAEAQTLETEKQQIISMQSIPFQQRINKLSPIDQRLAGLHMLQSFLSSNQVIHVKCPDVIVRKIWSTSNVHKHVSLHDMSLLKYPKKKSFQCTFIRARDTRGYHYDLATARYGYDH